VGLRVAAARGLLVCGDPHGPQRALGELDRWMTDETVLHLRSFATVEGIPGLVARSVEALMSVHLVAAARHWWPNSAVAAIAALGRVSLLDRLDRLDVVTDAEALTEEAVAVLHQSGSARR
jgi:hypothetical protein